MLSVSFVVIIDLHTYLFQNKYTCEKRKIKSERRKTLNLRPYQQAAVDAVYNHLRSKDNNPCVVIPTAGGKSCILAQIAKDAVEKWNGKVLILAHVKELLEQNSDKIRKLCRN